MDEIDYSLVAALGIAIITLVGIIFTRNSMKKSNDLLEQEISTKLRPFFSLKEFHVTLKKDEAIIFRAKLENYGNVPARKITMYERKTNNDKLIELCKEKDELSSSRPFGTLQHNGRHYFESRINLAGDTGVVLFLIWFEYTYFEKTEESAVLCRINLSDLNNVQQEWFIEEDIVEARKEQKEIRSGKRSA